jgi:carbamoyl-phosphate synthase small subunit
VRNLARAGCKLRVLPPTSAVAEILACRPDGIFLSNGPGDPDGVDYLCATVKDLIGQVPIFGICLGHQILARALGAKTYKLKFGHRGGNHPVLRLETGSIEITAQNHGFAVDFDSIGAVSGNKNWAQSRTGAAHSSLPVAQSAAQGRVQLTHVNLNDMTVEGIRLLDAPAFSVQYHPEAAPGPHDAHYLFNDFLELMSLWQKKGVVPYEAHAADSY